MLFLVFVVTFTFICIQINGQIVPFDKKMGSKQVLPLWVRVDLGIFAMKGYSTFPTATGLESHHHV